MFWQPDTRRENVPLLEFLLMPEGLNSGSTSYL
jgi:hypothetical protein